MLIPHGDIGKGLNNIDGARPRDVEKRRKYGTLIENWALFSLHQIRCMEVEYLERMFNYLLARRELGEYSGRQSFFLLQNIVLCQPGSVFFSSEHFLLVQLVGGKH